MNQYSVTGPFPYSGYEPGSTFEAKANDAIKRAVARGSITPVKEQPKPSRASAPAQISPAKPSGDAGSKSKEDK